MPEDKFIFLGKRIRSARKECQLTQQELADQSGLAVKTIQDIEKGRKKSNLRNPKSISSSFRYFRKYYISF